MGVGGISQNGPAGGRPVQGEAAAEESAPEITPQTVWSEFVRAKRFNEAIGLYDTVEKNEHFYIGDQWHGVNAPDLDQPVMNMLSRVVKYLVASVMSDDIGVSVTDFEEDAALKPVLEMLSAQFDAVMEGCGFRRKAREAIRNAAVDGDGCLHFYFEAEDDAPRPGAESIGFCATPGHIEAEIIENTNVHFGNPQQCELQRQPYLLLHFRRLAEDVRRMARENGGDAEAVQPDEDEYRHGDAPEEGKVTVVRRYWKQRGRDGRKTVWFCEATDGAMVRGPTDTGYTRYPIAFFPWEKVKDQFHGQAAITGMIPNQIFVNKLFAMAMQHVKHMAFPKIVYNRNLLAGRKWSNRVGEAIGVNGDPNLAVAAGLRAPDMSSQVLVMIDKAVAYTRDTMGASDAALGNVAPENTSAIIAVQKATGMPLELQRQDFYTFVEDSVRVWMDMMARNYGVRPVRLKVRKSTQNAEAHSVQMPGPRIAGADAASTPYEDLFLPVSARNVPSWGQNCLEELQNVQTGAAKQSAEGQTAGQGMPDADAEDCYETVPFDFSALQTMNLRLNVDVGAATYWSELMQVQTLDNLFARGVLTDAVTYLENMPRGYIPGRQALIEAIRKRQQAMPQALAQQPAEGRPNRIL